MPKKRNFLGGMQNYNAQTGEYEPALKGPNGESPSGFKSFKKQEDKDESFDTVNKKRMGKDTDFTSEDYVDDFYDRVSDLQKEINTSGIDDDEYDAEINKLKEELETKKDSMSEDDYNKTKEMLDRFSRPTDDDFDANDEDSIWNAFESGKITEEERNKMLSKRSGKIANESFDKINAKRMGKEQLKSEETQEDKDFNAEIKKTADDIRSSGDRYTYMMLDRLRSDAEYVLGEGKGAINQLWYNGDPKKHIALMKDLHNGLKDKPEWLSMEKINEYEKKFNDLGPVYVKDNDRKKLAKAGFTLDDTYSGGDTYEIYDKDTGRNNSISLSDNGKYYYTTINGTVYYYEDLDTAIDRATYKSGKAPSNSAIGWENGSYDNERAEKKLKELRGY